MSLIEPHTPNQTTFFPTVAYWEGVSMCVCVRLCTGSLAAALQAQEHHFSPDELCGVITVPQRPVTHIKAPPPRPSPAFVPHTNENLYPAAQTLYSPPSLFGPPLFFCFSLMALCFDLSITGSRTGLLLLYISRFCLSIIFDLQVKRLKQTTYYLQ